MQKLMLVLLVISGVAFVVQTVLGFLGVDDDFSGDSDTAGIFGFFTIRNIIAFLLGFSAAGYLMIRNGYPEFLAVVSGLFFGTVLAASMVFILKLMGKLEQTNEIKPYDYRGVFGTVTVRIPGEGGGQGKVEFTLNERIDEMPAVTNDGEEIPKGTQICINRLLDNGVLLVSRVLIN